MKEDVIKCKRQEADIEATVHSVNMMYEDENTDAISLVNSSYAFNSFNSQSFSHNISFLCPPLAIFVQNC